MKQISIRARTQHGLITREQLLAAGRSEDTVDRWVEAGRLERVHAGVYRLAGVPRTWEQDVLAAVLAAGGVASHRTAARLWGVHDTDVVEVTVPRGRRSREVVAHRSGDLAARHVTKRHGIPVTNPMRTLVDLGAVDRWAVGDAVERALIERVCGIVALERVLDDIARLLREHALPPATFQHRVGRHRIDFAYPDLMLAIEVDGFEVHATPTALQADLERQNRLVAAGWTVLRFTWRDVVRRPAWVARQVEVVLRQRQPAVA